MQLFDLSGRTALVTGSSRGLGFAIAEGLAQAGAALVLNGTNRERLAAAVAELRGRGYEVREQAFDVAHEDQVAAAFDELDAAGVAVDVLVNNAGVQHRQPLVELPTEDWQRVIDTNLTGVFVVAREAAKRMLPRGQGKIINIGSLTSEFGRATIAPYAASKGGVKMLTQVMAAEWAASGLQANAIGPGYMLTDLNEALVNDKAFDSWVKGRVPARRWGDPEELVGVAVFLASAASNYVNGQIIYVDGGMVSVL